MLLVGDPQLLFARTKRYWEVGEEATQHTGDTFVSVKQGPDKDEVTLDPVNTGKLDASETRPETFEGALAAMEN